MRTSIEDFRYRLKAFLAGSIPNLKLEGYVFNLDH